MTIHKNSVAYFKAMAAKAIPQYVKDYWNRRAKGAEDLEKQLAARAEAKRKLAQREDNLAKFKDLDAPKVRLESKHPNGCIVHWEPPTKWEPDTYMVLVKDTPTGKWRSVASSNITRDSRWVVLTKSYLAWGEYKEPYYIAVAAVRDGVGRKESESLIYPPDFVERSIAKLNTPNEIVKETPMEVVGDTPKQTSEYIAKAVDNLAWQKAGTGIRPAGDLSDEEKDAWKERRKDQILEALDTYKGKVTPWGRPYVRRFRKHLNLTPEVSTKELRQAFKEWKENNYVY